MKRYVLISVLLLVAFMWSCDNKVSSPYSPEDLTTVATNSGDGTVTVAGKGGGRGPRDKDATYTIEVYFDGVSVGMSAPVTFGNPNSLRDDHMRLNLSVLSLDSPDGLGCFPGLGEVIGSFAIYRDSSIGFWFNANNCTKTNYTMWMANAERIGDWPPAPDDPTIFTGKGLNVTFNKRQCENACEGTVTPSPDWTVVVTKISE